MEAIQTQSEFVNGGGRPEAYASYVAQRTEELEASVRQAAASKAKSTIRVRVRATGWPRGCTHYRVPAKAPFDARLKPGDEGYEMPFRPEPALSLPIGQVSEVPIRDERHLATLKMDPILEFLPDETPTHQEEKALLDAALQQARSGSGGEPMVPASELDALGKRADAAVTDARKAADAMRARLLEQEDAAAKRIAALEADLTASKKSAGGPVDITKLSEADAVKAVEATGDVLVLLGWLKDADARGAKALAAAVVAQLDVLGDLVGDAFRAREPKPEGAGGTPKADEKPQQQGKSKGK